MDFLGRLGALERRARVRVVGARTGDDDSAPDWKILLSSQPESPSSNVKAERRACAPASVD